MAVMTLLFPSAHAANMPLLVNDNPSLQLQLLGDATLRWFGFTIYDATLWSENELFDGSSYSDPVMLSITYRKSIPKNQLIDATEKQWSQFNWIKKNKMDNWLHELHKIWPDVSPGDVIACVVLPSGVTQFFSQNEYLGSISDPQFGPGFLSIWLSPESSLPKLRRQLLKIEEI